MYNLPAKQNRTCIIKSGSVKQKKHHGAPEQINTLKKAALLVWIGCHSVRLMLFLFLKAVHSLLTWVLC